MKITIVYDNTSLKEELKADWGFSAFIETKGKKILFDTGAKGDILLQNMEKLKIDSMEIEDIFISHPHWDHVGGLPAILKLNNKVKIWVPSYFKELSRGKEIVEIKEPKKLYDGIYSTGELDNIEQSLCIETEKGIMIIAGCSHPYMGDIIKTASHFGKVYGIIGGLHGNKAETLKGLQFICATHCTKQKKEIITLYPNEYIEGGVGKIIEIK